MPETKKINPWLKLALELGPIAIFFIGFSRLKDATFTLAGQEYHGFILMTALFVPLMLLTTGILWKLTGKLSKMQVATVVLVVIFGGLISSTLLDTLLTPLMFWLWGKPALERLVAAKEIESF